MRGRGLALYVRHGFPAVVLAMLVACLPVRADNIVWVGTDFPPMAMSQGAYAHEGYIDMLYKHLQEALPQHVFREEIVPWSRAMAMVQRGGPYCMISAFQTPEREAFLRFTEPYGYLYPIGVVIRAADKGRFAAHVDREGNFVLDGALQHGDVVMGVASSRSYGPKIDVLLQPLVSRNAANVHQAFQGESTKFLLAMLENRRFDFMLAYPSEVEFYGGPSHGFHFYPIAGNDELLPGRFSCTRSAETDRVFAEVAKLVRERKTRATFMAAYERWLPTYLLKSYRQRLAEMAPGSR